MRHNQTKKTIENNTTIRLSALDSKKLAVLLMKPAEASPYLQKSAKEYKQSGVRISYTN